MIKIWIRNYPTLKNYCCTHE